ncbi:MAG: arylsulfatase [Fuerstiella sp.]
MKYSSLLATLVLLLSVHGRAADSIPADRPNIVLIMVDDMGWSDIGPYGAEIIQTPNLDRLAAEGLRFRQFYNNAKCTTTRASLLTGLYPRQGGRGITLLDDRMITLGEGLRLAGYQTGISGKWHNGSRAPHRPVDRGFDKSYGLWDGCCNFFDPSQADPKFKGGRVRFFGEDDRRITEFPDDFYTTDAFADRTAQMIRSFAESDDPFFVYVPFTAPHYPIHAKPEDIAKYKGRFSMGWDELQKRRHARTVELGLVDPAWDLPPRDPEAQPWVKAKNKDWQNLRMEVYAAMIDSVDQGIGRILTALQQSGAGDNTLVLFLSDNGSCAESPGGENNTEHVPGPKEFYSHVGPSWAFAQNAPFRRYKSRMHEGGIATPLIAHWPGVIPPATFTDQVGHIVDLLPTFLETAGATYPASHNGQPIRPVEGISLLHVLKTPDRPVARSKPLFWAFAGSRAVRDGNWKLAWDAKVRKWELYDMVADRTEMHDLTQTHPEKARELAAAWEAWADLTDVKYK